MSIHPWISAFSATALDPARTQRALEQIADVWPADLPPLEEVVRERFVDHGAALAHLLSVSPVSVEKLVRDPAALVWLADPGVHHAIRGARRMQTSCQPEKTAAFDSTFRALRQGKGREMLRIALREVGGWSSMEQTTLELTVLAEVCVAVVCEGWLEELAKRWGRPESEFAVLGMGKFGGVELNYSSDIDVIFFYGAEGELNAHFTYLEFFKRLAEKIVSTFATADSGGALFRIDLRLRPEGASGPLVCSIDAFENYYSAYGETWERMALIKARVVAGSSSAAELGYEFTHRLQPFIFPRAVSPDILEEIRAIKVRIEREIVGQEKMRRNVKLGYGGIREIEFVAQTLQLLHGARHPFLQERSTLKTLTNLRQLDIIPQEEMEALIHAYRFLRTVEHRLQIEREAQTHTLPEDAESLERLALSLAESGALKTGNANGRPDRQAAAAAFSAALERHTSAVRSIFDRVLGGGPAPAPAAAPAALDFFAQPERARKVLQDLHAGPANTLVSPRTRRIYARLEPLLLEQLQCVADPDAALNRFVRFVERYGIRGLLFETLIRSPRLLELLVRLFDASEFMTEIALRRPQLIEEAARDGGLGATRGVSDYLAGLAANDENLPWQEWGRAYRHAQILRTGLRDVLGFATIRQVQAEHTALAEACLTFTQKQLGLSDELTIVALGKFGGGELVYGADLDVVFLGERIDGAAAIIRTMSAKTAEGSVFAIDARLRPEGEAGQLAIPLVAYERYFNGRAQLWEAQALTKARVISGPQKEKAEATIREIWRRFGEQTDLEAQIAAMHARIVHERAGTNDALELKTGSGGLMQVEFFTQARQMRAALWQPNTIDALSALAGAGQLSAEHATRLTDAYLFLRKLETILRRQENLGVSRLPSDEAAQSKLAIRAGLRTREKLLAAVQAARGTISELAAL